MPVMTIQTEDGPVTAFICGGRRPKLCSFCHHGEVTRLCDFKKGDGKTCDAGMCDGCATSVGAGMDYCPTHKHSKPLQASLFGGGQ
jgi:hypothetical protein